MESLQPRSHPEGGGEAVHNEQEEQLRPHHIGGGEAAHGTERPKILLLSRNETLLPTNSLNTLISRARNRLKPPKLQFRSRIPPTSLLPTPEHLGDSQEETKKGLLRPTPAQHRFSRNTKLEVLPPTPTKHLLSHPEALTTETQVTCSKPSSSQSLTLPSQVNKHGEAHPRATEPLPHLEVQITPPRNTPSFTPLLIPPRTLGRPPSPSLCPPSQSLAREKEKLPATLSTKLGSPASPPAPTADTGT